MLSRTISRKKHDTNDLLAVTLQIRRETGHRIRTFLSGNPKNE